MIKIGDVELEILVNIYELFGFNRTETSKKICEDLIEIRGKVRQRKNCVSENSEGFQQLTKEDEDLAKYINIFTYHRRLYDRELVKAEKEGTINSASQARARELIEQIRQLTSFEYHDAVIQRCLAAIDENCHDAQIYYELANAYCAISKYDEALDTIERALRPYPDNLELLELGAKIFHIAQKDFESAQIVVNRMLEVAPHHALTACAQAYLHLDEGREDLAFELIDRYVEKHPGNDEFRSKCAFYLVQHSHRYFTQCFYSGGEQEKLFSNKKNYEKCLKICNKAATLYNDDLTANALREMQAFGQKSFNHENKERIIYLLVGAAIFLVPFTQSNFVQNTAPAQVLVLAFVPLLLLFCAWRSWCISQRPRWQIVRYEMTGKRELEETIYICIGNIFTWYLKLCFLAAKLMLGIMAFMFLRRR